MNKSTQAYKTISEVVKILGLKSRIGRNPKTKEEKKISERNVVLFKPSKEFKELINIAKNG